MRKAKSLVNRFHSGKALFSLCRIAAATAVRADFGASEWLREARTLVKTMAITLKAGDPAPDFEGVTTDGKRVSLADFRGRKLVMYFYPKDDTPGCTRQACSLRDHSAELAAKGAAVLGVSTQGEESHRAFTRKFNLNFPLLADTDGKVGRAYGTLGGGGIISKMKTAAGMADRVTFVIDEEGRIAHVIDKPKVASHAEEVLALL
jgi:peroxiredoxin Q/BCP